VEGRSGVVSCRKAGKPVPRAVDHMLRSNWTIMMESRKPQTHLIFDWHSLRGSQAPSGQLSIQLWQLPMAPR
jgi:hypothetical protein